MVEAGACPAVHARVKVVWKDGVSYLGSVADVDKELGRHGVVERFRVFYDDGDKVWHTVGNTQFALVNPEDRFIVGSNSCDRPFFNLDFCKRLIFSLSFH